MKDMFKSLFIYSAAFLFSCLLVVVAAALFDRIQNPYSSFQEYVLAAIFIIPIMVVFDKVFITRKRPRSG